eukprot:UN09694
MVIFFIIFLGSTAYGAYIPAKLKDFLLKDYRKDQMPTSPISIGFGLKFLHIINVDERMNMMSVSVWVRLIWNDPRLRWDKSKFNNVESIYVPVQATGKLSKHYSIEMKLAPLI